MQVDDKLAKEKLARIPEMWVHSKTCDPTGAPCTHQIMGAEVAQLIRNTDLTDCQPAEVAALSAQVVELQERLNKRHSGCACSLNDEDEIVGWCLVHSELRDEVLWELEKAKAVHSSVTRASVPPSVKDSGDT